MKFNNFSSTPGRVMVHIGLVLVQGFKRSPCGPVMKLPLLTENISTTAGQRTYQLLQDRQ